MKKWIFRIIIAVVILIVLAVLAVGLFLDSAVKRGVETVGPMVTKVPVKLDSVGLSLFSGSGKIKGLVIGNPPEYKTPSAIQVGRASLAVQPRSLFADKVVIRSIQVEGPEITYETDLKGNNLSKIVENLQSATGGSDKVPAKPDTKEAKANKKLQVDDFQITGGKIHVSVTVMAGKTVTVPLPPIHLTALGQGPDGITAAELTKRVLQSIEKETIQAASGAVADLSRQATAALKDARKQATGAVDDAKNAAKGIGDLFKKK